MGPVETRHLISYLFAGEDGRQMAERIDTRINRLPGLEGIWLIARARERYGAAGEVGVAA